MRKTDIPEINSSSFSYENFFNIYENDQGFRFFNLLKNISIFPSNNSELEGEYISDYTDTWYSISHRIYGNMNLWWLICLYNSVLDPFEKIKSKTLIKYLRPNYVGVVLAEISKQINK
jgi:hypothetical protein